MQILRSCLYFYARCSVNNVLPNSLYRFIWTQTFAQVRTRHCHMKDLHEVHTFWDVHLTSSFVAVEMMSNVIDSGLHAPEASFRQPWCFGEVKTVSASCACVQIRPGRSLFYTDTAKYPLQEVEGILYGYIEGPVFCGWTLIRWYCTLLTLVLFLQHCTSASKWSFLTSLTNQILR